MAISALRSSLVCSCVLLAACHGGGGGYGGGGGGGSPPATYTVGGTLSGLSGSGLVLRNNAGNDLAVPAASGSFTFSTALVSGAAYSVTVGTQPTNPSQTCSVTGGGGTVGAANVSSVQIACTTNSFTVGATVTGLDASGLVLQNNGANDLAVASDGTVTFPGNTMSGAAYAVTVKTQPTLSALPLPAQLCTVTNGSGTVGSAAVNVAIACLAPVYKFLHVANELDGNVSVFSVNASTGQLTAVQGAPYAAELRPRFVSPEPSGKYLYALNAGDAVNPPRVSAYTSNASGVPTQLLTSPFPLSLTSPPAPGTALLSVSPIIVHRSGAFGYVTATLLTTRASTLYGGTIASSTGELTEINGFPVDVGFSQGGSVTDSGGRVLFFATNTASPLTVGAVGQIRSFVVDPSGSLTFSGQIPTSTVSPGLPLVTPGDNFLLVLTPNALNAGTIDVFAIGKTGGAPNGTLSPVGTPVTTGPLGSRPVNLAFNRRNNVVYVTNQNFTTPALSTLATFRMDPATGLLTAIGSPISSNGATAPAFLHPSGRLLVQYNGSTASYQRFAIDPTTFAPTLQADVTTPTDAVWLSTFDFSGKYLYSLSQSARTLTSYRMDAATGALTLVNSVATGAQPFAISPVGFQPQ